MKKYSIATHTSLNDQTVGITIEGDGFYEADGALTVFRKRKHEDGSTSRDVVGLFAKNAWLHVFEVDSQA